MSFFFAFPEIVGLEVISIWIEEIDLVFLDTSVCNEKERKLFVELLSTPSLVLKGQNIMNFEHYLDWIILRKLKIGAFVVSCGDHGSILTNTYENILKPSFESLDTSEIQSIHIKTAWRQINNVEMFTKFCNACPKLDRLILINLTPTYISSLIPALQSATLKQLVQFVLKGPEAYSSSTIFDHLAKHTGCLKHLEIESRNFETDTVEEKSASMIRFIVKNKNLEHLKLFNYHDHAIFQNHFYQRVGLYCLKIKHFTIDGHVSGENVELIINSYKNLSEFVVQNIVGDYVQYQVQPTGQKLLMYVCDCDPDLPPAATQPYCIFRSPQELEHFFDSVCNLTELELIGTHLQLNDKVMLTIALKSPKLLSIIIQNAEEGFFCDYESSLTLLIGFNKKLEYLEFFESRVDVANDEWVDMFSEPIVLKELTFTHCGGNVPSGDTLEKMKELSPLLVNVVVR